MLDAEADHLCNARRYEHTEARTDQRAGHYKRKLHTKAGWSDFLAYLTQRGLKSPELFISDKGIGLIESLAEYYPQTKCQRCTVHFYRNVFPVVPRGKVKLVAAMPR